MKAELGKRHGSSASAFGRSGERKTDPAPACASAVGERKMDPALGLAIRIFSRSLGFVNLDPSFFLGLGETG